jgi:hypothetical protein
VFLASIARPERRISAPLERLKTVDALSDQDKFQAGDGLEVADVERDDIETEVQGCCADDEVFDRDGNSFGRLLPLDASSGLRDGKRDRMHDHVADQLVGEGTAPHTVGIGLSPVDAVRQLDDADGR